MYSLTCGAGQATSRNDSYHSPLVLLAAENMLLCPLKVLKVEHPTVVSWKTLPGVPGGVPEALQPPVPEVGEGRGSGGGAVRRGSEVWEKVNGTAVKHTRKNFVKCGLST